MLESYGFFDSVPDDERSYEEIDFARMMHTMAPDGVYGGADSLAVNPASTGLNIVVSAGCAVIRGRYYVLEDDGSGEKTFGLTAPVNNQRIDRVVLVLDFIARRIYLKCLQGDESTNPVAPTLERNASQYQLSIASIRLVVGAQTIRNNEITDEREDELLCGLHVSTWADARKAAALADAAAEASNTAATAANQAASAANTATTAANTATSNANASAERANTATSAANTAANTANAAANNANAVTQKFSQMTVTAVTRNYGSGSTASLTDDGTKKILALGLERGAKGDKGDKGDTGATGPAGVSFTLSGTTLYINLG